MSEHSTILEHPNAASVTMEVVAGAHEGMVLTISRPDSFLVGRTPESDMCLSNDPHFSRHHFRLTASPPNCVLLDLGSRNGTFVNGARVQETVLRDGDEISGGETRIRVMITRPQASKPPSTPEVFSQDVSVGGLNVGDSIGSIGEVAKNQESLSKRLGDVIQGRPEKK